MPSQDSSDFEGILAAYRVSAGSVRELRASVPPYFAYTAAAGAVLALAPSADAAIQYSGRQDITLAPTATRPVTGASVDINGDLIEDFRFDVRLSSAVWIFTTQSASGLGGFGMVTAGSFPDRLPSNATVSVATPVPESALIGVAGANWPGGTMDFGGAGFLGVGIRAANGSVTNLHYAWIRVGIATNALGDPIGMTIYDWAWESDPEIEVFSGVIPEPAPVASLALLGAGAAGIAAWRRRKSALS